MKLGFVSTVQGFAWGGSEELWARTAIAASKAGHDVFAAVHLKAEPQNRLLKELVNVGATLHYVRGSEPIPTRFHNRCLQKLGLLAIPEPPRRFSELENLAGDINLVSSGATAHPVTVPELADCLLNSATPYALLVQHARDTPDPAVLKNAAVLKRIYAKAKHVFFVAQRNADMLQDWLDLDLPSQTIVRNPINLRDTDSIAMPDCGGTLKLAQVGRLDSSIKAQDLMIDVLAGPAWRDRDYCLTFWGSGPHQQFLESLIRRRGLGAKVFLAGASDDIRSVWADNHVLVMPSRSEGTPLSMVEAMLCGRPAVVTDVAGMPDWITEGENGFVADGPNITSLGSAMERLWDARDRLEQLGNNARQVALDLYDPDPAATMLTALSALAKAS